MTEVESVVLEVRELQDSWQGDLSDIKNTKNRDGVRIKKEKMKAKLKSLKKRLAEVVANHNLASNEGRVDKLDLIYKTCVSTQSVVVESLIAGLKKAVDIKKPSSIGLSGGVSANPLLRSQMQKIGNEINIPVFIPNLKLTGDNAVMIALSGLGQEFGGG